MRFEVPPEGKRDYGNCRSCETEVIWIKYVSKANKKSGKTSNIPLDVPSMEKDSEGNVTAESHFAHCPQSREWRKK